MFDFYQKRKLRSWLNSRLIQGGLVVIAFMISWSAFERYVIAVEMAERSELSNNQASVLQARKDSLSKKVDYLSNERGIEAEMRRQFDVALPGEQVVVIVEDEVEEIIPLATSTPAVKRWYEFWR